MQKNNFVVSFFFHDRYPHCNSTVDSTATVEAVVVEEEEEFMVYCCLLFSLLVKFVDIVIVCVCVCVCVCVSVCLCVLLYQISTRSSTFISKNVA